MHAAIKILLLVLALLPASLEAQEPLTLKQARILGATRSRYLNHQEASETAAPRVEADLKTYRQVIAPLLTKACLRCHGDQNQEAGFRIDRLNPDLLHGNDEDWWLEVQNVLSNSEMPPADAEVQLTDEERAKIIEWLSQEVQFSSTVRRGEKAHSSFRRLTRYEFTYAVQDLLGLPLDFGADLPPEAPSEDGFFNSSEFLQMSVSQLEKYRELARKALTKATVRGERPAPMTYSIPMAVACRAELGMQKDKPAKGARNASHFFDETSGQRIAAPHRDVRNIFVFRPENETTEEANLAPKVLMLPPNSKYQFNLGHFLPPSGPLKIRVKASHIPPQQGKTPEYAGMPSLEIRFGFKPTNDSYIDFPLGPTKTVDRSAKQAEWFEWEVYLSEFPRNAYRQYTRGGHAPNPTEFIMLRNTARDRSVGTIRIEDLQVSATHYPQWPPQSHLRLFPQRLKNETDDPFARRVLAQFMRRSWRREIAPEEIERKLKLLDQLRPTCDDLQEALIEVLATVISSPNFLYLQQPKQSEELSDFELASRLSVFLWASIPDDTLLDLAAQGKLGEPDVLLAQTDRMLKDARSKRFSEQFVRQWLGLQLLDYLDVDRKTYRDVDQQIIESMKQEPIEMFRHVLNNNLSVIDFLHSDYTLADRTLARHYGIKTSLGSEFKKVSLEDRHRRGGLLTQSGLLAMNSDGKDSNPLKRGVWLLERILNDPPPPPPAAVPEIDLADPEILKMTLKQRLEDHRNDIACKSCHQRIDPWGIAFENYDAVGRWRDSVKNEPVDASSILFNQQQLEGVDGLKRYLLENRQDQFARALVTKMSAYALGRPIGFSDRSEIESMTAELRNKKDGLATLVKLIVTSKLFRTK